jgi:hypothetical protein
MGCCSKSALRIAGGDRISSSLQAAGTTPLSAAKLKEMTMKKIIVALAFLVAATPAALAQSAYTTGSAASNAAAGYPSPYGSGYYAYAPRYDSQHATRR